MEKIKLFIQSDKGKDILTVVIVILVGLGSFELGRVSKEANFSGIRIEYPSQNTSQEANAVTGTSPIQTTQTAVKAPPKSVTSVPKIIKNFFASSRGNKYYPVGCSAGKTIKMENRVYFETRGEAEKAGYELSSACQ